MEANIWVIDQHFTQNVGCALTSVAADSASLSFEFTSGHSSGTNALPQKLVLDDIVVNENETPYISCSVPPVYSGERSSVTSAWSSTPAAPRPIAPDRDPDDPSG
jgi:hypothetical protein